MNGRLVPGNTFHGPTVAAAEVAVLVLEAPNGTAPHHPGPFATVATGADTCTS